ncbi:TPA: AAA family ATPase [Mannheimia haemolytica]|nr:AAA family ATPase [Mannheimia haemolytica]AGI33126.1 hypothetical protein D650_18570 [Mannheimia haemolytica USDA-ARS-USMARC-183]EME04733.1 hypothetical protein F388_00426 [Mannheimia haemolytica serotype 6 str. H23]EPZ27478.1 regulatory protein [Mannheimia haemolytica MhBrain2012]AGQ39995.1 regulatory protein [Mannheimia haemolytica D174]AKA11831.1 regulatory protein [Mannheimia haemolytica]
MGIMSKSISIFNHKGGIAKTTTAFNVGWSLANQGYQVLLVDLDSQCNLTGLVLGYDQCKEDSDLALFYNNRHHLTMEGIVEALINGQSPDNYLSGNVGQITQTLNPNLFLLPGHLNVSELDSQISVSLKIAAGVPATRNIPGNLPTLIKKVAEQNNIDYILYDLSPNVGGLNEVILMSSDYFIVPTSPDFFCWQAVGSLAKNIRKWHNELKAFKELNGFNQSSYAIKNKPQFLGTIQQRYRPRKGQPAKSFEKWIERIRNEVITNFVPVLKTIDCAIDDTAIYAALKSTNSDLEPFDLAHIADFNSLIAISQELRVPVFSLTKEQIKNSGQFGHALNTMDESKENFDQEFQSLAERIIQLTN